MEQRLNQILIYCEDQTKRLNYIVNVLLSKVLGIDFELICDKYLFESAICPKFSYAESNTFPNQPFLKSHALLFEKDIHPIEIDVFEIEGFKAFFKTNTESFFPFDIFAASFYLVSRYEEYLPHKPDIHGRFRAEESLAYKEGFLEIPLVNIWIMLFCNKLCQMFPDIKPIKTKFSFLSTIDIDNAWAHQNKGLTRTFFSFAKIIIHFNLKLFIEKINVLIFNRKDPYHNYDIITELHARYGIEPIYFILFSKYGQYDKNPSRNNLKFRELIKSLSIRNNIGLHPSYQSNYSYEALETERKALEQLINRNVTISRQHYLMLKMPETYENLIELGILQDYSMGYSSHVGFRASFCFPYRFFNLTKNEETLLEIVPFQLMDVSFKDYQKIKPEIALEQIKKVISSTKKVNGLFVSLWHNDSFKGKGNGITWLNVFEQMLEEVKNGNQTHRSE